MVSSFCQAADLGDHHILTLKTIEIEVQIGLKSAELNHCYLGEIYDLRQSGDREAQAGNKTGWLVVIPAMQSKKHYVGLSARRGSEAQHQQQQQ